MKTALLFLMLTGLTSCVNYDNNIRSMNDPGISLKVLIDSIENYGDVEAFKSLETASLDYRHGEFLSTFLIMADKYNHANACMTVYYKIGYMYNVPGIDNSDPAIFNLDSLNPDARAMAIRYLLKADALGNKQAKDHLSAYRKNGLIK